MNQLARKTTRPSNGDGRKPQQDTGDRIEYVSLSDESRRRYLNYALSVITSRALPDVRDGLKPVQRRILFVMYDGLGLTSDAKFRKCAKICGDTTGNYHPHGEGSVYDALCRMAQDFSFRYPLVDGWGNFGSVMGLPAAAMRYPEARLRALAEQLMNELRYDTVDHKLNYDAQHKEPTVLPARFPNLLVNGTQGIAVGMATSIPPHNLSEVIRACVHLIDNPGEGAVTVAQLLKHIKGPDFPLGGRIVSDRKEIRTMYEEGRGSVKVRAEWKPEESRKKDPQRQRIVIESIPYCVETGPLMIELQNIVTGRKLPQLLDVSDHSDADHVIRIMLDLKPGSDPEAVMAYLYKHTQLEQNFAFNSTCLIPDAQGALVPRRLDLVEMLRHYLDFRFVTVKRRFEFQLRQLEKRIHILEGFKIVFDGLDKALRIIRQSQGRQDAAKKLMAAFPIDEIQTDAILEIQLYKISQLEIDRIVEELKEKRAEADRIRSILGSNRKLWGVVRKELEEVAEQFGDKRRTSIGSSEEIGEFDPQAYIVRENTNVVLTRDGWVKRVGRMNSVESTRVREGDEVLNVVPGSTLDQIVFFSSEGIAYTFPVDQIPPSSGYGEPLSKHVKLGDGAQIVTAITTDSRFTPAEFKVRGEPTPGPHVLVATAQGQVLRIPFAPFRTPSTRSGRKYCKLAQGDKVVAVELAPHTSSVFLASGQARILHFKVSDVPVLTGAGKGVRGMKLEPKDSVLGFAVMSRPSDCLRVRNVSDKVLTFGQMKYSIASRGGRGIKTSQRTGFTQVIRSEIVLVDWSQHEEGTK
ncbi:MAG: DNA topoisomerase IV subunit A [Planctomycetales bacterium]